MQTSGSTDQNNHFSTISGVAGYIAGAFPLFVAWIEERLRRAVRDGAEVER